MGRTNNTPAFHYSNTQALSLGVPLSSIHSKTRGIGDRNTDAVEQHER